MTSASRAGLLAASSDCSVPIALAASSARLLSAAWAPMASDTMPRRPATKATERREMWNWLTFITVHPGHRQETRGQSVVAPVGFRFEGRGGWCRAIALNLRHRNKQTLTPLYPPSQGGM